MGRFGRKGKRSGGNGADEPAPQWAAVLGSRDRYETFEACVRGYFKGRGLKVMISDGVVRGPAGQLGPQEFGLSNLSQVCAQTPEAQWPEVVEKHFAAMERSEAESEELGAQIGDYERVSPRLGVRLYEPEDLGGKAGMLVTREDVPGLLTVLVVDLPSAIRTVRPEEVEAWGVGVDAAFARGIDNLAALASPEVAEQDLGELGRLWAIHGESFFTASLLLRLTQFPQVIGTHGTVVGAPTRHMLLAVPLTDGGEIRTFGPLMTMTEGIWREGPGSVSRRVWWTRDGRWIEVPYEITHKGLAVRPTPDFLEIMNEMAEAEGLGPEGESKEPTD